jgi:hypothetical protein
MLQWQRANSSKLLPSLGVALVMLVCSVCSSPVWAASSIARAFQVDDDSIVTGAVVSLKSGTANTVELATAASADRLLGVAGDSSLIELSSGKDTIQIVTSGEAKALVSDINGKIKVGDKISASPIAGVGMKTTTSSLIIGTAQADLATVANEARDITDKQGKKQTVHIGVISVQVDKVFYESSSTKNSYLAPAVQDFASNLVGHAVSPVRIMIALLLVFLLLIIVTVLLYSAVRSSIISIGRNPLSKSAIWKSMIEVNLTVLGISAFVAIVIYLILVT